MDVRCEKCQTEYELDEARLKPGGVTVKCTNCGHTFKIRKRTITNVGAAPPAEPRPRGPASRPPPAAGGGAPRADSLFEEAETARANYDGPTTVERQWRIRLENGDQKSCRELATLQQWIIAGVVTRESLISRTGKTWKRLGDITELAQYFDIADEARTTRESRPTGRATPSPPAGAARAIAPRAPTPSPVAAGRGTMLGVSGGPQASGGTILPDDEDDQRTGRAPALPPRIPPGAKTPPMGSVAAPRPPSAVARPTPPPPPPAAPPPAAPPPAARPITSTPPPPPAAAKRTPPAALPVAAAAATPATPPRPPLGDGRSTAAWANEPVKPAAPGSAPFVGKLAAIPDEPAFAGRVRAIDPESGFKTGKVTRLEEEDDDLLPPRRGSRAGLWIVLALLAFGGAAAAGVYMFVIKQDGPARVGQPDPGSAQAPAPDAELAVAPAPADAAAAPASPELDAARGELLADGEARLRAAFEALGGKDEPAALALRAHLAAAIAQALTDRAGLVADRGEASKLRAGADAIVIDAATAAQRALKAAPDDAAANLAMAAVLRLQRKPAAAIKRYSDAARAKADPAWARDLALADALLLARENKLEEARAAFAAIDQGEGKLETSSDVRARFHLARIALAQGQPDDARPLVEQVLAAQPEHAGARALAAKLETSVARTDPLPPEDPKGAGGTAPRPPEGPTGPRPTGPGPTGPGPTAPVGGGGSYDALVKRANVLAETNCTQAMALFQKALEQKPNGVEALTGMGYCHIDQKQFASAFGKFRAALAISSRYEPALWGVGEAYQQQGRKEQAIESYQRYLEAYPGTAKALRQLERLGASPGATSPSGGAGSTPAPAPAPAPTPPEPAASPGAESSPG